MRDKRNTIWNDEFGFLRVPWIIAIAAAGVTLFTCILLVFIITVIEIPQCHQGAERQGTTGSYKFPSGCYYRLANGNELPAGEYPAKRLHIQ